MKTSCFFQTAAIAAAVFLYGCGRGGEQEEAGMVTVSGTGTVYVAPDMACLTVSAGKTARTTRLAQEAVGRTIGEVGEILRDAGIEDKDITTASLRFGPEYEWHGGRRVLVGQHAEQSVSFAVRGIGTDGGKAAALVDRLAGIDGITIDRLSFGVEDNARHFVRSRELAYEKALQKARQYAGLSGCKVGKVLSISESAVADDAALNAKMMSNQAVAQDRYADDAGEEATLLPAGQLEIRTRITAVFRLE